MSDLYAATAEVVDVEIPQFIQDALQRTAKVRQQLSHIRPEDVTEGQIWRVKTPIPLWDTIDPEHRLGGITFCMFISEVNGPEMQPDEVYGYLCLGVSKIHSFPVLERELERWEYAPYCWWVDIRNPGGVQPTTAAEFIMPTFPIYAKKEWLMGCEGDLSGRDHRLETNHRILNQIISWCESNGPDLDLNHPRNKIGGHTLMEILEHVKTCWLRT